MTPSLRLCVCLCLLLSMCAARPNWHQRQGVVVVKDDVLPPPPLVSHPGYSEAQVAAAQAIRDAGEDAQLHLAILKKKYMDIVRQHFYNAFAPLPFIKERLDHFEPNQHAVDVIPIKNAPPSPIYVHRPGNNPCSGNIMNCLNAKVPPRFGKIVPSFSSGLQPCFGPSCNHVPFESNIKPMGTPKPSHTIHPTNKKLPKRPHKHHRICDRKRPDQNCHHRTTFWPTYATLKFSTIRPFSTTASLQEFNHENSLSSLQTTTDNLTTKSQNPIILPIKFFNKATNPSDELFGFDTLKMNTKKLENEILGVTEDVTSKEKSESPITNTPTPEISPEAKEAARPEQITPELFESTLSITTPGSLDIQPTSELKTEYSLNFREGSQNIPPLKTYISLIDATPKFSIHTNDVLETTSYDTPLLNQDLVKASDEVLLPQTTPQVTGPIDEQHLKFLKEFYPSVKDEILSTDRLSLPTENTFLQSTNFENLNVPLSKKYSLDEKVINEFSGKQESNQQILPKTENVPKDVTSDNFFGTTAEEDIEFSFTTIQSSQEYGNRIAYNDLDETTLVKELIQDEQRELQTQPNVENIPENTLKYFFNKEVTIEDSEGNESTTINNIETRTISEGFVIPITLRGSTEKVFDETTEPFPEDMLKNYDLQPTLSVFDEVTVEDFSNEIKFDTVTVTDQQNAEITTTDFGILPIMARENVLGTLIDQASTSNLKEEELRFVTTEVTPTTVDFSFKVQTDLSNTLEARGSLESSISLGEENNVFQTTFENIEDFLPDTTEYFSLETKKYFLDSGHSLYTTLDHNEPFVTTPFSETGNIFVQSKTDDSIAKSGELTTFGITTASNIIPQFKENDEDASHELPMLLQTTSEAMKNWELTEKQEESKFETITQDETSTRFEDHSDIQPTEFDQIKESVALVDTEVEKKSVERNLVIPEELFRQTDTPGLLISEDWTEGQTEEISHNLLKESSEKSEVSKYEVSPQIIESTSVKVLYLEKNDSVAAEITEQVTSSNLLNERPSLNSYQNGVLKYTTEIETETDETPNTDLFQGSASNPESILEPNDGLIRQKRSANLSKIKMRSYSTTECILCQLGLPHGHKTRRSPENQSHIDVMLNNNPNNKTVSLQNGQTIDMNCSSSQNSNLNVDDPENSNLYASTILELLPVIREGYRNNAFSEDDKKVIRSLFGDMKALMDEEEFGRMTESTGDLLMGDGASRFDEIIEETDYDSSEDIVDDMTDREIRLKRSKKNFHIMNELLKKVPNNLKTPLRTSSQLKNTRMTRSTQVTQAEASAILALLAEKGEIPDDEDDDEYEYYEDEEDDYGAEDSYFDVYEDDYDKPSFGELIKLARKHRERKARAEKS